MRQFKDLMETGQNASLVSSNGFSDTERTIYVTDLWDSMMVAYKKIYLAKVALLQEAISRHLYCPVSEFSQQHLRMVHDRKASFPAAANIRLKSRRGLLNWAANSRVGGMAHNSAPRLKVREEGYHSWAEQERAKFEARHDWNEGAFRV